MSAALKEDFRCSSNQAALASPSLVEVPQLLLWLLVTSDHVPPLFQTRLTQRKAKVFSQSLLVHGPSQGQWLIMEEIAKWPWVQENKTGSSQQLRSCEVPRDRRGGAILKDIL